MKHLPIKCFVISLPEDTARRDFQKKQAKKYQLDLHFIDAVDGRHIRKTHPNAITHWHRPMSLKEGGCFLSHRKVWAKIAQEPRPVIVLEDDSVLSDNIHEAFCSVVQQANAENCLYDIEWVPRKHLVAKKPIWRDGDLRASRIYINKNGSGGYIIGPAAAATLLEKSPLISLTDAHIWNQTWVKPHQIEPALSTQLLFLDKDVSLNATKPCMPDQPHDPIIPRSWWIRNLCRLWFEVKKIPRFALGFLFGSTRYLRIEKQRFHLFDKEST